MPCGDTDVAGSSFFGKKAIADRRLSDFLFIFAPKQPNQIQKEMKELVEKINAEFEVFAANAAAQVEKGNKAAGTRARKSALELSKLMKEFRKESVEAAK